MADLVNQTAIAKMLGIKPTHVLRLYRKGEIPGHKVGKLVRFDPDEVLTSVKQSPLPPGSYHQNRAAQ